MLNGHVDVGDDILGISNCVNEFIVNSRWEDVHESNPNI